MRLGHPEILCWIWLIHRGGWLLLVLCCLSCSGNGGSITSTVLCLILSLPVFCIAACRAANPLGSSSQTFAWDLVFNKSAEPVPGSGPDSVVTFHRLTSWTFNESAECNQYQITQFAESTRFAHHYCLHCRGRGDGAWQMSHAHHKMVSQAAGSLNIVNANLECKTGPMGSKTGPS